MACGDVLSLEDLQTAKKHQIFEAEVITGKTGGVAGGATISTATNLVTGQTQQTLPSILADLGFDVQSWTSSTGGVLASANQVFLNDTPGSLGLGDYYAWGGPFPKTVPAGTDPALPTSGYIMRSSRLAGTQAREALRRSYAEAGYNLVEGSFEEGGTLVNANDVLLQERTGKAFSGPAGVVAAGTNPAGGGFVDLSGELLRSQLAAANSTVLIAGQPAKEVSKYTAPYVGSVERKLKERLSDRVSIRDFGVIGDGTEETIKIQKAVSEVCGAGRTLVVPPPTVGNHYICQDIQFPNTSWKFLGDGGATIVQFATPNGASNQTIFDMSSCNGPAKHLEGVGFGRLSSGSYDGITAIVTSNTNGLKIEGCWFRGFFEALNLNGSFFELYNVVCEYNFNAIRFSSLPTESLANNITYYRGENDLLLPAGDLSTFAHNNSTHIATKTQCINIQGSSAVISNVTAKDDGTGYKPKIINITGRNNVVSNVSTTFGSDAVSMQGAGCVGNTVVGLNAIGVERGVFISTGDRNKVIGADIVSASIAGVRVDSAPRTEIHAVSTEACKYGLSINALGEFRMYGGGFRSSVTADTHQDAANSTAPRFYGTYGSLAGITAAVYV